MNCHTHSPICHHVITASISITVSISITASISMCYLNTSTIIVPPTIRAYDTTYAVFIHIRIPSWRVRVRPYVNTRISKINMHDPTLRETVMEMKIEIEIQAVMT